MAREYTTVFLFIDQPEASGPFGLYGEVFLRGNTTSVPDEYIKVTMIDNLQKEFGNDVYVDMLDDRYDLKNAWEAVEVKRDIRTV